MYVSSRHSLPTPSLSADPLSTITDRSNAQGSLQLKYGRSLLNFRPVAESTLTPPFVSARPACLACLKAATAKGIDPSQVKCFYSPLSIYSNEDDGGALGKCSFDGSHLAANLTRVEEQHEASTEMDDEDEGELETVRW
jgi:hypothetical protein